MELVYTLDLEEGSSPNWFHALGESFSEGLGGVINRTRSVHLCAM